MPPTVRGERWCPLYPYCHCDHTSDRRHLREKGVVLIHGLKRPNYHSVARHGGFDDLFENVSLPQPRITLEAS